MDLPRLISIKSLPKIYTCSRSSEIMANNKNTHAYSIYHKNILVRFKIRLKKRLEEIHNTYNVLYCLKSENYYIFQRSLCTV